MNDLEEVFRGNPQGRDEPILDSARHPAEPSLVVLAFEDVNLGDGHVDLLSSSRSNRCRALMAFQTPADASRIRERTYNMCTHVMSLDSPVVGRDPRGRSAEYVKPFWRRHPR